MGEAISYDYSKPEYVLYRSDLLNLLGPPDSHGMNSCSYRIEHKTGSKVTWYLYISFRSNYVVFANLYSDSR